MCRKLTAAISDLVDELTKTRHQAEEQFEYLKSYSGMATKQDLKEMETNMAIKISELKTEVRALKDQVVKIWTEQQAKYDKLATEFADLQATLANQELDPDAAQEVADFKALLQQFDDTIPDVAPPA